MYIYIYIISGQSHHSSPTFQRLPMASRAQATSARGALRDDPGLAWHAATATAPEGDGDAHGHRYLQPQVPLGARAGARGVIGIYRNYIGTITITVGSMGNYRKMDN